MTVGGGTGFFKNISVLLSGTDTLTPTLARAGTAVDSFSKKLSGNSGLSGVSKSAAKDTESLGSQVLNTAKTMSVGLLGTAVFTGGIVALSLGIRDVIDGAIDFNRAMQNVQAISFLTDAQIKAMSVSVLDLSKQLPVSAQDLANALYPIASHGYTGAAALEVLDASARAAAAGLSTTETAATIIGSVLNAYGQSADGAAAASDALLTTVQHGVLTFDTLASTLSQTIGIASTAGISINEVGAAIDTMTRAGVTGDQAGTELNRVIQQLLKPTTDMALVYKELGFQSGYAALQTFGLHGVLSKLQTVTGDNVNTMLGLFTDVRAARGAMALMTDQGKLYNQEFTDVGTATAAAGATQQSLTEQAKSASFQLKIFGNDVRAAAINAGEDALPHLIDFVHGLENIGITIGHDLVPIVDDGKKAFDNLSPVIVTITHDVQDLVGLAGGAGLIALKGLGTAVVDVTGFLGKNEGIVIGLAVAYGTKLVASLLETIYLQGLYAAEAVTSAAATVAGTAAVTIAATKWNGLGAGIKTATAGLTSMISPAGIVAAGIAAVTYEFVLLNQETAKAKQYAASFTEGLDPNNLDASRAALQKLGDQLDQTSSKANSYLNPAGRAEGLVQFLTPKTSNTVLNSNDDAKALGSAYDALSTQISNVRRNAQAAAAQVGLLMGNVDVPTGGKGDAVINQFAKLAQASGIDLSKPVDESSDAVKKLVAQYQSAAQTVPGLANQMAASGTVDLQALTDAANAAQTAISAAQTAFASSTDIIANYSPAGTPADVAKAATALKAAQKQQQDAQKSSDQLAARVKGARRESLSQQQQQTDAADKLATATDKVKTAQQTLADAQDAAAHPDQQYAKSLQDQADLALSFVNGINTAAQRGLNTDTITQLLAAGPKAAAPILDALAADHSGKLIALVNSTQQTLSRLNQITVEDARLTAEAVQSDTDKLSSDLAAGLKIDYAEIQSNGQANADDIAKALGISTSDAIRIAQEFGITLNQHLSTVTPTLGQLQSVITSQIPKAARAGTYNPTPTAAQLQGVITSQVPKQSAASVGAVIVTNHNTTVNVAKVETNDGGKLVDQMKSKARVSNLTPGLRAS